MSAILFSQNDKIVGIFNDKNVFKTKSFHYILDVLIGKGYFKTKKQCGMKIKDDLKLFYEEPEYTFIYKDVKFSKSSYEMNSLEVIETIKKEIENNIFVVYDISSLGAPLEMLEVSDLYNKNE
jgi:hypothetical protein